jgi:transcriptional regulator with XRE-family HTH domain
MENLRQMQDAKRQAKRASPGGSSPSRATIALTKPSSPTQGAGKTAAAHAKAPKAKTPRSNAAKPKASKRKAPADQADLFVAEHAENREAPAHSEPEIPDVDPLEGLALPGADEPLVAICRQYLTTGLPVDEVLRAFLRDRTITRMCQRQAFHYRLSEAEAAELLHELGILFYRKLLPRLREPEKIWSVCALTAKRLAAGMRARIRELSLEDMGGNVDIGGRFEVDDRATRVAEALLRDSDDGDSHEAAVVARIDKERAVSELAALLQKAPVPVRASDKRAVDELRRSISFGPPGTPDPRLCDPTRTSPLINVLFDPTQVMPMPPDDQPSHVPGVERMPRSYGATLIKVRDELGMTQKDLAEALGISESSCAQYMAGSHGMPRHIWEEALELQEQGAPRRRRLRALFDGMRIAEILARWTKLVSEAEPGREVTMVDIARIVQVNKSTVSRWAKDEQRPPLDRLGELEDAFQKWLDKQRRAAAARR